MMVGGARRPWMGDREQAAASRMCTAVVAPEPRNFILFATAPSPPGQVTTWGTHGPSLGAAAGVHALEAPAARQEHN